MINTIKLLKIVKTAGIILLALLIVVLLWKFTKDWLKPRIVKALGGYTQMEMKVTRDTLDIKYKDIYTKYKMYESKALSISEPEYITKYKYTEVPQTKSTSITGKSDVQKSLPKVKFTAVKRYYTVISDSILNGKIETVLSLDSCKILSQSLKYEPKIPYIREKIITVVEYRDRVLSDKSKAYIGLGLDINTINQVTPQILYMGKTKWLYKAGYTRSLDNKYPQAVTIGIAKLF